MFYVEIYNKADFCRVVESFLVDGIHGRACFLAGQAMDRWADNGEEYDDFDYRVIKMEVRS